MAWSGHSQPAGSGGGGDEFALIDLVGPTEDSIVLTSRVTGDAGRRWRMDAEGDMHWGDGAGVYDWSMGRASDTRMVFAYNSDPVAELFRNATYKSFNVYGPTGGASEVTVSAGVGDDYAGLYVSDLNNIAILYTGSPELQFSMETTDIIPWAIIDTGHLRPHDATNTYDIGDATHLVRDLHIGRKILLPDTSAAAPSIAQASAPTTGMFFESGAATTGAQFCVGGVKVADIYHNQGYSAIDVVGAAGAFQSAEVLVFVDDSYTVGAGLFSSAAYSIVYSYGTKFLVSAQSAHDVELQTNAVSRWVVGATSGHLTPFATNAYDIGDDTHRVRDVYVADSVIAAGGTSSVSYFMGDSTSIRNLAGAGSTSYLDLGTVHVRNGNGANSGALLIVNGPIRTYGSSAVDYTTTYHDNSHGYVATSTGQLMLAAAGNIVNVLNADVAQTFRVWGALSTTRYVELNHDGINGSTLKNSQGAMIVGATNGEFYLQHVAVANLYLFTSSSISPLTPNTRDLGDSTNTFRTFYVGTAISLPDGDVANPSLRWNDSATSGMYQLDGSGFGWSITGTPAFAVRNATGYVQIYSTWMFAWGSTDAVSTPDLILTRAGAGHLQQANGTNGQVLSIGNTTAQGVMRVYGNAAVADKSPAISLFHAGSREYFIAGGAGTASLLFGNTGGITYDDATIAANYNWSINTSGYWLPRVDNTYDIGASGATRPRTIYIGTTLLVGSIPATTGLVRLSNDNGIHFRNAANDGNIAALEVDAGNNIILGNTATSLVVVGNGTTSVRIVNGAGSLGFFGTSPATQPTAVADASGGTVIDAEARTALNAWLSRARTLGLMAT